MDLMGMVNQAIAASDTEADGSLIGSLLGNLNNAPVDNNKIGGIANFVVVHRGVVEVPQQ